MREVIAFAPASIANLNVGFDTLGLALGSMGDTIRLVSNGTEENQIIEIVNGENLPYEADKNCCTVVIRHMQEALNEYNGVDVWLTKGFNSGSGLGSSSASSAAAAFAYNELMGKPFSTSELVRFAAEGERAACGSAHTDNVAPSILGGLILTNPVSNETFVRLPFPEGIHALTFFPEITINTKEARSIIKETLQLKTSSKQVSLMGNFIASLYNNDLNGMRFSMQDLIIEPYRKVLIPKYDEMKEIASDLNAITFGISGSGPTVFCLTESYETAQQVGEQFEKLYEKTGIATQLNITELNQNEGSKIIYSSEA